MENVEKVIELFQKKDSIRKAQFMEMKRKQIRKYNDLMQTLQTMKDKRREHVEVLNKNLQSIAMHEYSIHKLIHNSEQVPGLPISHDYHQQTITFLSEGIDFVNRSQDVYKNLSNDNENSVSSTNLINDITFCTNTIGSELHAVESQVATVKALQKDTDCLVGLLNCDDDDKAI